MSRAYPEGPPEKVFVPNAPPVPTPKTYKYAALFTLVLQTTSIILLLRVSRTASGVKYLSSTAVAVTEVLKVLICLAVMLVQSGTRYLVFSIVRLSVKQLYATCRWECCRGGAVPSCRNMAEAFRDAETSHPSSLIYYPKQSLIPCSFTPGCCNVSGRLLGLQLCRYLGNGLFRSRLRIS